MLRQPKKKQQEKEEIETNLLGHNTRQEPPFSSPIKSFRRKTETKFQGPTNSSPNDRATKTMVRKNEDAKNKRDGQSQELRES
jgi:hypothetical protein